VDLDDTLLREDLTISEENRKSLIAAEEAGVTVLLASGRVVEAMESYADILGMKHRPGYLISNNGCTITRSDTGEKVYHKEIDGELAAEVHRRARDAGFPTEVYRGRNICVDRDNSWTDLDSRLSGLIKKILPDYAASLIAEPPVKMVIPGEPDDIARFETELVRDFGEQLTIFTSKPYFLEVLPRDADKGIALAHLAEELGIGRESVMAIGDSNNDLGMLEWAGTGVAMANANDTVKAAARHITERSNEENGVAEAVSRFIFAS
jgi:Cof subfamily protein (haloacid dehalogenase superfamily)